MTEKSKNIHLQSHPLCEKCLLSGYYMRATEVSDDKKSLCKRHYDDYISKAFKEIYTG